MKLLLLFLPLLFSLSAFSNQNLDVILDGKLINSTSVLNPSEDLLDVSCVSNRNIVIDGSFDDGESTIKFINESCSEGTIFKIRHIGSGEINVKGHDDSALGVVSGGQIIEIYYHSNSLSFINTTVAGSGSGLDLLTARVDDLEALNIGTRLLTIEALDIDDRLSSLEGSLGEGGALDTRLDEAEGALDDVEGAIAEGGSLDTRLDGIEDDNGDTRLDALEAVDAGTRLGVLEAVDADDRLDALETGGGGSFDPANIVANLIPSTTRTYNLGVAPIIESTGGVTGKGFEKVVAHDFVSSISTGSGGQQTYGNVGRLLLRTPEVGVGLSAGTSSMWIKTGGNYTGQTTGTIQISSGTTDNSANTSASSGDLILTTGKALINTGNAGSIGGILIATGETSTSPSLTQNLLDATSNKIVIRSNQAGTVGSAGVDITTPITNFTGGAVAYSKIATYGLTPTLCAPTACTSSFPYQIDSLAITPAIPTAQCADGASICVAEIVIEISTGFDWSVSSNTTNKFVCIRSIPAGVVGQRLRVVAVNRSYQGGAGTNTTVKRVPSLIVGFASVLNNFVTSPVDRCSSLGGITLKNFMGTSAGAMQAPSAVLPEQTISSNVNMASATNGAISIGSTEFVYKGSFEGWQQL